MVEYVIRKATKKDIPQIKSLQDITHFSVLSDKEKKEEGFISVKNEVSQLEEISKNEGIIVAKQGQNVVGYEIPLTLKHGEEIPMLIPFIERVLGLEYEGKKLSGYNVVIDGQINVAKGHKGKGLAENMHKEFLKMLKGGYELIVTEISDQNPRSLHVCTAKLGFMVIDKYNAEGKNWYVLLQDIR
jgi:hypothetical protein